MRAGNNYRSMFLFVALISPHLAMRGSLMVMISFPSIFVIFRIN